MSNVAITVTANGNSVLNDLLGIEAYAKPGTWVSQSFSFGTVVTFEVPGNVWTRLRPQLNALANRRIPALDTAGLPLASGKTMPALSYSMDWIPGDRPRVGSVRINTTLVDLSSGSTLTVAGTNLLSGTAASLTLQTWSAAYSYGNPGTRTFTRAVDALRIDSKIKGPLGNKIAVSVEKPAASSDVAVTMGADGEIYIKVTPVTDFSTSTAIEALINGSSAANVWVLATALVAGALISPTSTVSVNGISPGGLTASNAGQVGKVYLSGGDGGGLARLDVPVVAGAPANRLVLVSNTAGNQQNLITLTITVNSGVATAATISGNDITVACEFATETLTNIRDAINTAVGEPVLASFVGSGASSLGALAKTWLYGGGGETPVATVGGKAAVITAQSDTAMTITVSSAALAVSPAVSAGDQLALQLQMNYGLVAAPLGAAQA